MPSTALPTTMLQFELCPQDTGWPVCRPASHPPLHFRPGYSEFIEPPEIRQVLSSTVPCRTLRRRFTPAPPSWSVLPHRPCHVLWQLVVPVRDERPYVWHDAFCQSPTRFTFPSFSGKPYKDGVAPSINTFPRSADHPLPTSLPTHTKSPISSSTCRLHHLLRHSRTKSLAHTTRDLNPQTCPAKFTATHLFQSSARPVPLS